MTVFKIINKVVYYLWIAIVVALGFLFVFKNSFFNPVHLSEWIGEYGTHIWAMYILVSFVRGFFLIPSTPFVLLGIVLFPQAPFQVLAVSMSGVVFSASLLYFFSDSIGFSAFLEKEYPKQSSWMREKLSGKRQLAFIYAWSIFPPVPTDLICYVTGIIKVRYWIMILGVFMGELTLNTLYVIMGQRILEMMY